jgi:hypothetical protein
MQQNYWKISDPPLEIVWKHFTETEKGSTVFGSMTNGESVSIGSTIMPVM